MKRPEDEEPQADEATEEELEQIQDADMDDDDDEPPPNSTD